jgi:predicted RecB family nuclease
MALFDKFVSASAIAERVLANVVQPSQSLTALPTVKNIARAANKKRKQSRPREPTDLLFDLDQLHIPSDFIKVSYYLII